MSLHSHAHFLEIIFIRPLRKEESQDYSSTLKDESLNSDIDWEWALLCQAIPLLIHLPVSIFSDVEIVYRDTSGGLSILNLDNFTISTLMTNSTFVSTFDSDPANPLHKLMESLESLVSSHHFPPETVKRGKIQRITRCKVRPSAQRHCAGG